MTAKATEPTSSAQAFPEIVERLRTPHRTIRCGDVDVPVISELAADAAAEITRLRSKNAELESSLSEAELALMEVQRVVFSQDGAHQIATKALLAIRTKEGSDDAASLRSAAEVKTRADAESSE